MHQNSAPGVHPIRIIHKMTLGEVICPYLKLVLAYTHSCYDQFCCLQTGGNGALPGILKRGEYSEAVFPTKNNVLIFHYVLLFNYVRALTTSGL